MIVQGRALREYACIKLFRIYAGMISVGERIVNKKSSTRRKMLLFFQGFRPKESQIAAPVTARTKLGLSDAELNTTTVSKARHR
jgi:hypothetical protein